MKGIHRRMPRDERMPKGYPETFRDIVLVRGRKKAKRFQKSNGR